MARRYRKRSKRKQEESLGELLATATAIITLFVTKGNLVATLIMMLIVGVGVPLIIKVYKQNKKKERYLTSGMADIDQMSGEEFEELLKYHFQEQGYEAQLTPKSHDYGADLVLKNGYGETIVVQAKRYGSSVGIKAIQEVIGARSYYNAQRAIVFTNNYFSNSAEQLAETSGVELYDRSELTQLTTYAHSFRRRIRKHSRLSKRKSHNPVLIVVERLLSGMESMAHFGAVATFRLVDIQRIYNEKAQKKILSFFHISIDFPEI